jgi:FkbM family methyltransferase
MSNNLSLLINFLKKYNFFSEIETIIEIGSRDCEETLIFNDFFPKAHIYAFECNPDTLPICKSRVKDINSITLVEKAIVENNNEDYVTFYKIDKNATRTTWIDGNPGASSLFLASGKYPIEDYVQTPIIVPSISLGVFVEQNNIKNIDLLWMDIQGAELMALRGLGGFIKNVGIIHLEVEFMEIYKNQPLFNEIKLFLNLNGFKAVDFTSFNVFSGDCIFVNNDIIESRLNKFYFSIRDLCILSDSS